MKEIEDAHMGKGGGNVIGCLLYNSRNSRDRTHILSLNCHDNSVRGLFIIPISQIRKWRSLDVNVNCPEDGGFVAEPVSLRLQNFCSWILCTVLGMNSN